MGLSYGFIESQPAQNMKTDDFVESSLLSNPQFPIFYKISHYL